MFDDQLNDTEIAEAKELKVQMKETQVIGNIENLFCFYFEIKDYLKDYIVFYLITVLS